MNEIGGSRLTELQALLESDLSTPHRLVYTLGPVAEGDIRAASAILRRWLGEGLIGKLCHDLGVTPSFPVLDNARALKTATEDPRVNYFLTAGVLLHGAAVMFIYNSSAPAETPLPLKAPDPLNIVVHTRAFLDQRRVYFEGEFFSCLDIIRFTANKLGGVHHDKRRDERQSAMQRASEYMTFGGPLEGLKREPPGPLYLNVEPNGREVLSGFHLEIIAAAASFIHIQLDGEQLMVMSEQPRRRGLFSRLFGARPPKFTLYDRETAKGTDSKR